MLPTPTSRRSAIVAVFLGSCAIGLLSSLFLYAYFGSAAGGVLLQPGHLVPSIVGDGVGAVLLLAILLPLRSVGAGPFWACGIAVVVVLWPPLSDPVSALLEHATGTLAPEQSHWPAPINWTVQDWFYCLLHVPDSLVLVTGSAILLVLVHRVWPAQHSPWAEVPRIYRASVPGRNAASSVADILFSFEGRLPRRPYLLAALAIGILNTILQQIVPTGVGLLLQIFLLWPLLALGTKRAHDRNHPQSWAICMLGLPGVSAILLEVVVAADMFTGGLDVATRNLIIALDLLIVVPVLWASVELFCLRGTAGANRYGPDPLAAGNDRRAVAESANGLRPGGTISRPQATFPPHVTPASAARFRDRFRKR